MAAHPSPSLSMPFSLLEHMTYLMDGTSLSTSFLLLIEKAECLVSTTDISKDMIPCKLLKPATMATAPPVKGDDDLLVLFAEQIDNQQASIKQLMSTLSGFENQFKQFKANYFKKNFSSGHKRKVCMPHANFD
jgi:hypothetical protein